MICPKCSKEIPENSIFCNYCGEQINKNKISFVRLIKNLFMILIFIGSLSALFLPIGTTNSDDLFQKLGNKDEYSVNININYSFINAFTATNFLNDNLSNEEASEEIFAILEKYVSLETVSKYRNGEKLTSGEISDLTWGFYFVNPYIYLSVERTRDVSQSIIFFIILMFVVSVIMLTMLAISIIMAIIDIFRPSYAVAVRKTVFVNTIFGIGLFFLYIIICQVNGFGLGPSGIAYFIISILGFLTIFSFKLIKSKRFRQLNMKLFIKDTIKTVSLIGIAICSVVTTFNFAYTYQDNSGKESVVFDSEGISGLFEIGNYKNVRYEELSSFEDKFSAIMSVLNGKTGRQAAFEISNFSTVLEFAVSTDVVYDNYQLVILSAALPYVILLIMLITLIQLFISLNNLYYGHQKWRNIDLSLTILKILVFAHLIFSSIILINEFNALSSFNDINITAYIGAGPIIAISFTALHMIFSAVFKVKTVKDKDQFDEIFE